jgi:ketosteroid isomerase-like protein
MKTPIAGLADFAALDPFFRIIEQGLDGLAGPGHFFDLLAEDAVFEYVIAVPDYPRKVQGRAAVAELYRPYGTAIVLDRCFDLAVHHDPAQGTVILEYASEGKAVATGAPYGNRYISVLTLRDREVAHWRDYLDPLAVFDALGWPRTDTMARSNVTATLPSPPAGHRRSRLMSWLADPAAAGGKGSGDLAGSLDRCERPGVLVRCLVHVRMPTPGSVTLRWAGRRSLRFVRSAKQRSRLSHDELAG